MLIETKTNLWLGWKNYGYRNISKNSNSVNKLVILCDWQNKTKTTCFVSNSYSSVKHPFNLLWFISGFVQILIIRKCCIFEQLSEPSCSSLSSSIRTCVSTWTNILEGSILTMWRYYFITFVDKKCCVYLKGQKHLSWCWAYRNRLMDICVKTARFVDKHTGCQVFSWLANIILWS